MFWPKDSSRTAVLQFMIFYPISERASSNK